MTRQAWCLVVLAVAAFAGCWAAGQAGAYGSEHSAPWPLWRVAFAMSGSAMPLAHLQAARAEGRHVPTVLQVDLRPDRYRPADRPGRPPWKLLYRGACLGCRWEGEPTEEENTVTEAAHDHTHPWWRQLPAVERPVDRDRKVNAEALAAIRELYEAAVPGCTDDPWCPIVTLRTPPRLRHHDGGALGGFDMGVERPS